MEKKREDESKVSEIDGDGEFIPLSVHEGARGTSGTSERRCIKDATDIGNTTQLLLASRSHSVSVLCLFYRFVFPLSLSLPSWLFHPELYNCRFEDVSRLFSRLYTLSLSTLLAFCLILFSLYSGPFTHDVARERPLGETRIKQGHASRIVDFVARGPLVLGIARVTYSVSVKYSIWKVAFIETRRWLRSMK